MKRIALAFLLAVVFYFGACFTIGAVAGAIAGARNPHDPSAAGAVAGAEAVQAYRHFVLIAAVAFGVLGAFAGVRSSPPIDEAAPAWPA